MPSAVVYWTVVVRLLAADRLTVKVAVVVLVIHQNFSYYWFHRCSHRVRWFWATHAIHHSSNEFNLATSYRFGWTGRLSGVAVFYVPMIWLGFLPGPVFIAAGLPVQLKPVRAVSVRLS